MLKCSLNLRNFLALLDQNNIATNEVYWTSISINNRTVLKNNKLHVANLFYGHYRDKCPNFRIIHCTYSKVSQTY